MKARVVSWWACVAFVLAGEHFAQSLTANSHPAGGKAEPDEQCDREVRVYYDEHGIPHVYAETDPGAFYGVGYLQMRSFPINTLIKVWSSSGRYAERVGAAALSQDKRIRHWEVPQVAQQQIAQMSPDVRAVLEGFVAGVEAGRAWWRAHPAALEKLIDVVDVDGESHARLHVNPIPNFLNESLGATEVPERIRWFFSDDPATVVTLEDFVCLGITLQSGVSGDAFGLFDGGFVSGTNLWAISRSATDDGSLVTLSDAHLPLNFGGLRHFFLTIEGDEFQAAGWMGAGNLGLTYGYNDYVSWLGSSLPGRRPRVDLADPLIAPDLPVKFNGNVPVVANTWRVDLEAGSSTSFLYDGAPVQLESASATLKYRDFSTDPPSLVDDPAGVTEWYWAPADTESTSARRYPVLEPLYALPPPGSNISFAQSFFTRDEHSAWEFHLGMGRTRNAGADLDDVLSDIVFNFGRGLNFVVCDRTGLMRYLTMSRVPIQGDGATAQLPAPPWHSTDPGQRWLDGSRSDYRWKGLHAYTDLPSFQRQIGPVDTPEVWINNVSSADHVDSPATIDPTTYPDYIIEHGSAGTRAQRRSRELLAPLAASGSLTQELSEEIALDKKDPWASSMWPLLVEVSSSVAPEHMQRVSDFVDFVEANKNEGEFDGPPGEEFVAHRTSSVLVYLSLIQSRYERLIARQAGLTDAQACLGFDPYYDPPDAASFTGPAWQPNIDALVEALELVAPLHENGTGPGGLDNQPLLASWNATLTGPNVVTPMPWSHARFNDPGVTRWGHVNVMVLTPHFVSPIPVPEQLPAPGPILDFLRDYFLVSFYSGVYPPHLLSLDRSGLSPGVPDVLPALSDQRPALYPMGGTMNTVYPTMHAGYHHAEQGLQPWGNDANSVYFAPHTMGSKVLVSVKLRDGQPAVGRFQAALGATEITTAIPENRTGAMDAFRTSEDFANGVWNELRNDEAYHAANSELRYCLTYGP